MARKKKKKADLKGSCTLSMSANQKKQMEKNAEHFGFENASAFVISRCCMVIPN